MQIEQDVSGESTTLHLKRNDPRVVSVELKRTKIVDSSLMEQNIEIEDLAQKHQAQSMSQHQINVINEEISITQVHTNSTTLL